MQTSFLRDADETHPSHHSPWTSPRRLVRYGDRTAEVLGEARDQRVMIKSIHRNGVERRSAVKWTNLLPLDDQLF